MKLLLTVYEVKHWIFVYYILL